MAIDHASYERLLQYRIPEVVQHLSVRDTMLYALGVGSAARRARGARHGGPRTAQDVLRLRSEASHQNGSAFFGAGLCWRRDLISLSCRRTWQSRAQPRARGNFNVVSIQEELQ